MVLIEIKPFRKCDMKCHSNFSKGLSFVEWKVIFISVDQKQKGRKRSCAQNRNSSKFILLIVCNQAALSFTDMVTQTLQHTKGLPAIHSCHITNRRASPILTEEACLEK